MINLCGFVSELEHMAKKHITESSSVADAVKILYMLNKLPKSSSARSKYVKFLQSLQGEKSGLCRHGISETAQVHSALSILDSQFEFPPATALKYKSTEALEKYSSTLPWHDEPDAAADDYFAAFSLLYCADYLTYDEYDDFVQSLYDYTDGDTGLIRSTYIDYLHTEPFRYLKGFFRYLMILEYTHSPIRYPSRTLDSCIQCRDRKYFPQLSLDTAYENLVWVYCISRTMKYTGYRFDDCKKRLLEFEKTFGEFIANTDFSKADLTALLMLGCIAAELQATLPGTIKTERPLNNVLNRIAYL